MPLDFTLTKEQTAQQQKAREFAIKDVIPVSRKNDLSAEFPYDLYKRAFDHGFLNLTVPKAYGGPGYGILESCLVFEEIAASDPGITTSMFISNVGLEPIPTAHLK